MKRALMLSTLGVVLSLAAPAAAQEAPDAAPPPSPKMERFRVSGGLKVGYVATHGFDTFADSNTLPQLSLDGTYAFARRGRFALAAGLGWDVGGRSSELRGLTANLTTHRFLVPIEARYAVVPWLWAFGKVAPGAALATADIEDPSAPRSLSDSGWAFAAEASAGASFVIGKRREGRRGVRFLITPEIGYAVTTKAPLHPSPGRDDDELLGSDATTDLRGVALSGLFWRASFGLAF